MRGESSKTPNWLMSDLEISGNKNAWVCPSDRHLALRAQLKTGWSVHSQQVYKASIKKDEKISDSDLERIRQVIAKAEAVELQEQERIGKLVERLENMRRRAQGSGSSECLLCGADFGILGSRKYGAMCHDCRKFVCQNNCGVATVDSEGRTVFLCSICSEYREMWKKSGAWFYQGMPKYVLPEPGSTSRFLLNGGSRRSSPGSGSLDPRGWVHASPRRSRELDLDLEYDRNYSSGNDRYSHRYRPSRFEEEEAAHGSRYGSISSTDGRFRRKLPQPPTDPGKRAPSRSPVPPPKWALEHNRSESYQSDRMESSSSDEDLPLSKRSAYRSKPQLPPVPPAASASSSHFQKMKTRRISDSESDNESRSPTPPSSPRGSLQTPSSHDQEPIDVDHRQTPIGESDAKSIDSGGNRSGRLHSTPVAHSDQSAELRFRSRSPGFRRGPIPSISIPTALGQPGPITSTVPHMSSLDTIRQPDLEPEQPSPQKSPVPPPISSQSQLTSNFHKQLTLNLEQEQKAGLNVESSPDLLSSPDDELKSNPFTALRKIFSCSSKKRPSLVASAKSSASSADFHGSLGKFEFSLLYHEQNQTLTVHVKCAKNLRPMDTNGFSDPYVKLHLLPGASKSTKLRTKTIYKTLNPEWNEKLAYYGITEEERSRKVLRLMVMDEDRIGSDFQGETRVPLKKLVPNKERNFNVYLEKQLPVPQMGNLDSERGKILLSLCYDQSKEALMVAIVRCAELIGLDPSGYSDPYVKVALKPDGSKKKSVKTRVKKRNCNPEFNEEFSFPIQLNELTKHWLEITVFDKDVGKADDYIGGILIGTNARGEPARQWLACVQNPGRSIDRWHKLKQEDVTQSK